EAHKALRTGEQRKRRNNIQPTPHKPAWVISGHTCTSLEARLECEVHVWSGRAIGLIATFRSRTSLPSEFRSNSSAIRAAQRSLRTSQLAKSHYKRAPLSE